MHNFIKVAFKEDIFLGFNGYGWRKKILLNNFMGGDYGHNGGKKIALWAVKMMGGEKRLIS